MSFDEPLGSASEIEEEVEPFLFFAEDLLLDELAPLESDEEALNYRVWKFCIVLYLLLVCRLLVDEFALRSELPLRVEDEASSSLEDAA